MPESASLPRQPAAADFTVTCMRELWPLTPASPAECFYSKSLDVVKPSTMNPFWHCRTHQTAAPLPHIRDLLFVGLLALLPVGRDLLLCLPLGLLQAL